MTQPSVNITEIDGALGILPPTSGRPLAIVGTSTSGAVDTPTTFARVRDVIAYFGDGPLVEAACRSIELYGKPVLCVRVDTTAVGSFIESAVNDDAWTGTSDPTTSVVGSTPFLQADIVLTIVAGGTIGTAGITYKVSCDGGVTYSAVTALGTATSITLPVGGKIALAAGDVAAGDTITAATIAPDPSTDIDSALDALTVTAQPWDLLLLANPITATSIDTVATKVAAMFAAHKPMAWFGNFRLPINSPTTGMETEAAYATAFTTAFGGKSTNMGSVCAGAVRLVSSVSSREYRQPVAFHVATLTASVSPEVNIADINLGSAIGASIYDDAGNPEQHDESVYPTLDDLRACVLRTWPRLQGVYVNRPLLLSATGSDFDIMPKRRVINVAHEALYIYFVRVLNKPIRVSKRTGFIIESEARRIEAGARNALAAVLGAKPMASAWSVVLSRTDVILSTKKLTVDARIVPLAYAETIDLSLGFENPALSIQQV